jgi:cyclopropane fatty-acyl-phospholipid synthase-like methyltransferase
MKELEIKLQKKENKWKTRYFKENFQGKLKPFIMKSSTHLDFGCGFGFLAYLLAKDYSKAKIFGIDKNQRSINLANKKYRKSNLKFNCTDKITGKYDSISAFFVIHHLKKNSRKYLREFYNHLNTKGRVIIFDFRKISKAKYRKWYEKKREAGEYKESFEKSYKEHNKWTVKQFSSLMKNVGFKTIKDEPIDEFWFFYVGKK